MDAQHLNVMHLVSYSFVLVALLGLAIASPVGPGISGLTDDCGGHPPRRQGAIRQSKALPEGSVVDTHPVPLGPAWDPFDKSRVPVRQGAVRRPKEFPSGSVLNSPQGPVSLGGKYTNDAHRTPDRAKLPAHFGNSLTTDRPKFGPAIWSHHDTSGDALNRGGSGSGGNDWNRGWNSRGGSD